jgi:hypothetical protein
MPGAPFVPRHSRGRRITYALAGVFVGLCTTFPNGLVSANLTTLPGSIDAYLAEASWLPAIYVAMNASANLTLVKARAQLGMSPVILTLLALYVVADILQLLWPTLATAVLARAINGMMAGGLVTLSVFYLVRSLTPKLRTLAMVTALGLSQLGIPLARIVPVELLAAEHWGPASGGAGGGSDRRDPGYPPASEPQDAGVLVARPRHDRPDGPCLPTGLRGAGDRAVRVVD